MTLLRFSGIIIFQPTRPLRGATDARDSDENKDKEFQPTRPLRGATVTIKVMAVSTGISTHAPLAGRDLHPDLLAHTD